MYALWVPDETGRTAGYNLNMGGADTALVYTLQEGSDSMAVQKIATVNGYATINVTETPLFVTAQTSPDSLFTFSGAAADSSAALSWQCSSDSTVQTYVVESSANGTDFAETGRLASHKSTNPNSTYHFMDVKPALGVNYYRLRRLDVYGHAVYSKTIAISFSQPIRLTIYPNPAVQTVTIEGLPGGKTSTLSLTSNAGKALGMQVTTNKMYTWDVSSLAAGVYYITVNTGGKKARLRFVKAN
jgi:hypothetical protein